MAIDVSAAERALEKMTVPQLKQRYAKVYGEETRTHHRVLLIKRILWRMQALREGDLSERARQRARELANDADLRRSPPRMPKPNGATQKANGESVVRVSLPAGDDVRLPAPGSVLRREYKGRAVFVRVLPKGFEYEGEVFRSLSAIAAKVTGSHWNGFRFFGLCEPGITEGKA
ncbi:MAG: DUF2924 domain-containing protein [Phycisphaerales bacterium]|nr:DUF2924 domain-containing protein [Phycisphaerales bacterium]